MRHLYGIATVDAGSLRHRVQLQTGSSVADGFGQTKMTWSTDATMWASISSIVLTESFQMENFTSKVTHEICIRYSAALVVQVGKRIIYGSHVYLIQAIDNAMAMNVFLRMQCLELDGIE